MSNTRFTRGPYRYESGQIAADDGMLPIARVFPDDGHADPEHRQDLPQDANGCLLAASPEMCKLLDDIYGAFPEPARIMVGDPLDEQQVSLLRAIGPMLDKAEGQT